MKKITLLLLLFLAFNSKAQTSKFSESDSLLAKGRYKLALKVLDEQPKSFVSLLKKATIYESIDAYKKAILNYETALTIKNDYTTKLKLAKNYRAVKQYKKAIKIYEDIIDKDSLNLVLKYQLGKLYIITKNPKKAERTFKSLEKEDKTNANYSYHLGLSYALQGKRDPMINSFIDTFEKDTLHVKAITRLANSFQKLRDKDSTQLFVEKGLAISPNDYDLNTLKINQLYKDEEYAKAIPYLLNLDTLYKKETYPMYLLGRAYYHLDSLEKAKKYLKRLSFIDKEDFKANTYLGHIALKEKDYRSAQTNYLMATYKGKKKRDEEFYGLATVFYELKKPKQAIKMFEKAHFENPRNYRALYQYAKLSDDYYKDKKIAYKLYIRYVESLYDKDEDITNYVKKRIAEIKKEYFMKGESLK